MEKSLSVDNLFVFMLLLSAFAVPAVLQQRVLLFGIAGALVLRGVFIALGAAVLANLSWAFVLFGAILLAHRGEDPARPGHGARATTSTCRPCGRCVCMRRFMPVTDDYRGPRMSVREGGRRMLTPLAVVVTAVFATDVVFAVDSVPAVFGITGDPYLVFATNAFALLGLRALYFVLQGALSKLVHLGYGLAAILGVHRRQARPALGPRRVAGRPGDPDARLARGDPRGPRGRHRHQPVRDPRPRGLRRLR